MTLVLRNTQRIVNVNLFRLEKEIAILRKCFGVEGLDLSVLCICDEEMATLNSAYHRLSTPTDVLAIPYYENLEPETILDRETCEEMILGDVFLGVNYIYEECKKYGHGFHEILPIMVTHGMCHLLGYDHRTDEQWRKMYTKELNILEEFNRLTGAACRPLTAAVD